jgi:hypothetical protein
VIPAPDAFRCEERHPDRPMVRCFRVTHDIEERCCQAEVPRPGDTYHATDVLQWNRRSVSEFPLGPHVDADA